MRPPILRILADDELVVDNFAGGGGASTGIAWAIGRDPDIAINHDPEAIAMHAANHPRTRHLCENVWAVDPIEACAGRPVGLAWFSPDCTHHSKAKGGKPRSKKLRALAWVVIRWARTVRPRVIILENVEEFADWGPLRNDGTPDPAKRGLTFRIWLGKLRAAGYNVEQRELRACDYGAPTTRKRLFIIARRDGKPIVWPLPTHGRHGAAPYRTAAECIDWSIPCPSIFGRKKPLAEATLRRVARGIRRFILESPTPFLAPTRARIAPTLVQTGYGERRGQTPRALDLHEPLGTVVAGGQKHALVAAFLAKHYGGHEGPGSALPLPFGAVTCRDHHALVTARATGDHRREVRAFLARYNGDAIGQPLQLPLGTVTTARRFGLVVVAGQAFEIADIGMRMLQPRELFRAQSFDDSYVIDPLHDGAPLSKTAQIAMAGNSVPPVMSEALVRANGLEEEVVAA